MPRGRNKVWFESSPGGIRGDLNPATIPKGEWKSSSNWLCRNGRGKPRPGYSQVLSTLAAGDRVTGIHTKRSPLYQHAAGYGGNVVVHTESAAYYHNGSSFAAITGTWSTTSDPVRFVSYTSGGTEWVLRVNLSNAVDKWDGTSAAFQNIAAAPAGRDITSVGGYVIVCQTSTYGEGVQWNSLNDVDTWPSSNGTNLTESFGTTVACRALNSRSFAVYKRSGIWVGSLQAAKAAFQFQFVGELPGPGGPSALVNYRGTHYWLSPDMQAYAFDGSQVKPIGDGIEDALASIGLIDSQYQVMESAVLIGRQPELWFILQSQPSFTNLKKALVINLSTGAVSTHEFAHYICAAATGHINSSGTQWGLLLGSNNGKVYEMYPSKLTDDGTAIAWNFEYGYVPTCNNVDESGEIDAVASYWKKTSSSCTVTVSLTPSDSISDDETAYTDTFDTSTATSNHSKTFRGKQGKWAKLKFSGTSVVADLEYRGALLTSWQRSMT